MKRILFGFICFLIAFQSTAQDFQAYLFNFKPIELPIDFNQSTLKWCRLNQKQLKPISKGDLQKFIPKEIYDPTLDLNQNESEKQLLKNTRIYYFKKVNLSPNFISVLIYLADETSIESGVAFWKIILLNYTPEGKSLNFFELAYENTYMTYRQNLAKIDQDLKIKVEEIDYESMENMKKPNYVIDFYYKLNDKNGELISTQHLYYPYEGTFESGNQELSIYQNRESFSISEGDKTSNTTISVNLLTYNLDKGEFTFEDEQKIKWQGKFDADKNKITLTKSDNTVLIFTRKELAGQK